jgi:hypothetical protein
VSAGEVHDATHGWVASESGVRAVVVVGVEPAREGQSAVFLPSVGTSVGPLLQKGSVEALDLSVGLGSVGTAVTMADVGGGERFVEQASLVREGVVGENALDDHALGSEPALGTSPERGCGGALLVSEDFGVGQAGVVVDGRMEVGVADSEVPVGTLGAAMRSPSATFADTTQLLHVHVHQLSRAGALVAADLGSGGPVEVPETVEVVADEDAVDSGGGQSHPRSDAILTQPLRPADANHPGLELGWGTTRGPAGAARTILEANLAELQVAMPPLAGALTGDTHLVGDMGDRRAGLDTPAKEESTVRGEGSVTVCHRDLRGVCMPWSAAHLLPEVLLVVDPIGVTNVPDRDS